MPRTVEPRYEVLPVTVAAGVAQATPTSTSWPLGGVILEHLTVLIPPGHSGLTGVAVAYDGTQLLPWAPAGTFFTADDREWGFEVGIELGHPLTISGYNTDIHAHTFYLRARVRDRSAAAAAVAPIIITTVDAGAAAAGDLGEELGLPPFEPEPPPDLGAPPPGTVPPPPGSIPAITDEELEGPEMVFLRKPGSARTYTVAGGQLFELVENEVSEYGKALGANMQTLIMVMPDAAPVWTLPLNTRQTTTTP